MGIVQGQTSSGKTYTMGTEQHLGAFDKEQEGIVPRAASLLFDLLQQSDMRSHSPTSSSTSSSTTGIKPTSRMRPPSRLMPPPQQRSQPNVAQASSSSKFRYTVKVSFIEIYNEELVDLLNSAPPSERPPVTIREDTKGHIYWTGVKEMVAHSAEDVMSYVAVQREKTDIN